MPQLPPLSLSLSFVPFSLAVFLSSSSSSYFLALLAVSLFRHVHTRVFRFSSSLFSRKVSIAVSRGGVLLGFKAERGLGFFGKPRGKEDDTNVGPVEVGVTFHGGYVYHDGVKIGDNETSSLLASSPSILRCSRALRPLVHSKLAFLLLFFFLVCSFFSTRIQQTVLSFGGSFRLEEC